MEIVQIVSIGIIGVVISSVLKKYNKDFSIVFSIVVSLVIFAFILPFFVDVLELFMQISNKLEGNSYFLKEIIKIIAIAYIAEFGYALCLDAGENAIATKIQLGGKILIMSYSAPIVTSLTTLILNIM